MAKEFEVSYVASCWYNNVIISLTEEAYNKAIENDNLDEVLQELYWDSDPEITETTKSEYFIKKLEEHFIQELEKKLEKSLED
tara:strand:- start:2933 stop:3181 length:249 start_codon:yes stop_codon:yes gene_type:complete